MNNKQVIVIPARMKGTRLSGKPLIKILDKPMIWHVWNNCIKVHNEKQVYIATEDQEIYDYCNTENIQCVLTGRANTAIERIALFSDIVNANTYINVQGDEPLANPEDILSIIEYNNCHPDRIVFGKTICNEADFKNYSKAKVVCDLNNKLLYSSRAGIPLNNKGEFISAERAIWIYAFNKSALDQYYSYRSGTHLEIIEDNEIIRFLEIGIPVYCVDLIGDSWAVDTLDDLVKVNNILKKRNE
jgi:3-deoxy-manno-octulosonate cytidylyltransferase (CMP-KDO synthetase)